MSYAQARKFQLIFLRKNIQATEISCIFATSFRTKISQYQNNNNNLKPPEEGGKK